MRQTTPYRALGVSEHARELACVREVLADAAPPTLIYEAFGGVGMLAAFMSRQWPAAQIRSWELDAECVAMYRARQLPNATVTRGDTRFAFCTASFDAASIDFNQFTLLDLTRLTGRFQSDLLTMVCKRRLKWVQLTDSAVSHLHLNWARYGLERANWEEYVGQLNRALKARFNYHIVRSAHHRRASYFRLEPVYGPS